MVTAASPRRSGLRRARVVVPVCVVLLLLAVAGWLGVRGAMAAGELRQLQGVATDLQRAASDRDVTAVRDLVERADGHATRAHDLTSDPVWRVAEALPVLGENARAVRVVSGGVADLAGAVIPLFDAIEGAGSGSVGIAGAVDLLGGAEEDLVDAAHAARTADGAIAALDVSALIDPLADGVRAVGEAAAAAASWTSAASDAAGWLPPMLGADGPRSILVVVQNPAELRAGGGLTGSFVLLEAHDGRIEIADHVDSSSFPAAQAPVADLPESARALYGDVLGTYVQNASMTPDFALTAQLATAWWATHSGVEPDAVVSIDPIVLQGLLVATGPAPLPDGSSLSAANLVDRVLVQPYLTSGNAEQSEFQRAATLAVFDRLLSGQLDPLAAARGLGAAVEEGRISVRSTHAEEQARLDDTPLAGTRARQLASEGDAFAVLLNDATTAKLDSFLEMGLGVREQSCRDDGRFEVVVSVRLQSDVPPEGADYPILMTGIRNPAMPGDLVTDVAVAAPEGWFFGGVTRGGAADASTDVVDGGLPTSVARLTLAPGESDTLQFRFIAAEPGDVDPVLVHTPMIRPVVEAPVGVPCS